MFKVSFIIFSLFLRNFIVIECKKFLQQATDIQFPFIRKREKTFHFVTLMQMECLFYIVSLFTALLRIIFGNAHAQSPCVQHNFAFKDTRFYPFWFLVMIQLYVLCVYRSSHLMGLIETYYSPSRFRANPLFNATSIILLHLMALLASAGHHAQNM